ncbi:hypothetical protein Ancab_003732 [Ancistrocladus abbreviatus]
MGKRNTLASPSRQLLPAAKKPKPHFFKIMLNPPLQQQKLEIPKKFMSKYGKELLDVACLKVPSGEEWKVKLLKWSGRAWFQEGWEQFVKFYSIVVGHFILFKYKGNSHFRVIIFDTSASEIEYPLVHDNISGSGSSKIALKKERIEEVDEVEIEVKEEDDVSVEILDGYTPRLKAKAGEEEIAYPVKKYLSSDEKARVLKRVRAFSHGNPSFVVKMQPSHVTFHFRMIIPSAFVKEHLTEKENKSVILLNRRRTIWAATYSRGSASARICGSGWKEFLADNQLKVGDICVFEMAEDAAAGNSFRVFIFRS